jgi:hypothetical protein
MKIYIKYGSRAVRNTCGVSVEDKYLAIGFKGKVKRTIHESTAALSNRRIPGAHRGRILAVAVTLVAAAAAVMVVWAPLPRAHLMVSLVTSMASCLAAAGFGSHPYG